ncbi:MAG: 50S ribosomal protein L30 [Candidatus Atabeyarchaeum deiterrae]|jgi:large subunit ribosomal protein L30
MSTNSKLLVIRIRGDVDVRDEIRQTLKMLRLHKVNHATLIDRRQSYLGMLQKVKDYTTWGEVNVDALEGILAKRGRAQGNRRIDDEYVKNNSKFKSVKQFAEALITSKATFDDVHGLKPVFRLHPPKGGFEGKKKKPFKVKGELGYRGESINNLISKMV